MSWFLPRTLKLFLPLLLLHPVVALYMAWSVVRWNLLRPVHLLKGLASLPRSLEIYTAVHLEKPDLVHLFWGHYPALVALAVQRYLPEIPVTLFLGAYDLMWGYGCTPPAARTADWVFTHAGENREAIEAFGVDPSNIRLIWRGIDFRAFEEVMGRADKRPFSLVTAGKLVPQKRFDLVIRTAAELRKEWPSLHLVLIGDGPEREALESLAGRLGLTDAVHFTGGIPHREVFEMMSRAEIFLFLSQKPSERLPNVAKEAIACRAVAVVNPSRGIRELIPDDSHGVVLGAGETVADRQRVAEAAEAVSELWRDPARAEAIRVKALEHLREQFDLQRSIEIQASCWEDLTGKKMSES